MTDIAALRLMVTLAQDARPMARLTEDGRRIVLEACDEIERLRAEVGELRAAVVVLEKQVDDLIMLAE